MPKIEYVADKKNPTWHIGNVYWTERPDYHFFQRVVYEWRHTRIGFSGKAIAYIPGDASCADFVDALDRTTAIFSHHVCSVVYLTPDQIYESMCATNESYGKVGSR